MPRAFCIADLRAAAGAAAATACGSSVMAADLAASGTTAVLTAAVGLAGGAAGAAAGAAGTVANRAAAAADPATTAARRVSAGRRDTGLGDTASSFVSTAVPTESRIGGRRRTRSHSQCGDPVADAPGELRSIGAAYNITNVFRRFAMM